LLARSRFIASYRQCSEEQIVHYAEPFPLPPCAERTINQQTERIAVYSKEFTTTMKTSAPVEGPDEYPQIHRAKYQPGKTSQYAISEASVPPRVAPCANKSDLATVDRTSTNVSNVQSTSRSFIAADFCNAFSKLLNVRSP
jgi:hypothetical protein